MRIVFDESTLKQSDSASHSITGVVFLDFGGKCFPGEGWNDFPVIVAAWWLEAATDLRRGIDKGVNLGFMDGPYWVTLSLEAVHVVILRCTEDRVGAGVVHEEHVDLDALVELVRGFAERVLSACVRCGLESIDVDSLRKSVSNY